MVHVLFKKFGINVGKRGKVRSTTWLKMKFLSAGPAATASVTSSDMDSASFFNSMVW